MSWLDDLISRAMRATSMAVGAVDLMDAGQRAVLEADALWRQGIFDPKKSDDSIAARTSRVAIDKMIRSSDGLGWSWLDEYEGDGAFEWCGAFAARCWGAAGLALKPSRYGYFSSTARLARWFRYQRFEKHTSPRPARGPFRMFIEMSNERMSGPIRFEDGTTPRAGDILILGDVASLKHITLVDSYDEASGTFHTYEGNGYGMSPNGTAWQGVVKGKRQLGLRPGQPLTAYHARLLGRLAPHDLTT
jgi:hypothetical protein